jgi:nondiscriminating glutamyl-tRNA synthetase
MDVMKQVRTRFAPSPTGYMHIGNLRTALYEYLVAKQAGGAFILRIEDTDQSRLVEGSVDVIYDTLKRVGLDYDEGPDKPGAFGPYIQSQRLSMYKDYALQLVKKGGAHVCFCDESVLQAQKQAAEAAGVPFKFVDPCHRLSPEEVEARQATQPYVIRQTIQAGASTRFHDEVYGTIEVERDVLDEQVLLKSDGFPTYNFANVIDDHTMNITHVVRGNEYLASTPKYNLLYESFGWDKPIYIHVPPVMKDEQNKLSKRSGDASFQDLLAQGFLPEAILNYIALLGWAPEGTQEIFTLDELVQAFDVKRISRAPAIFDRDKLVWMNGQYVRAMAPEAFYALVETRMRRAVKRTIDWAVLAKLLQQRIAVLSEVDDHLDFIDVLPDYDVALYTHEKMKTDPTIAQTALSAALSTLENISPSASLDEVHAAIAALPAQLGLKNGQVYWPIRTALTGKAQTPGGALDLPYLLGQEESLKRLRLGLEKLAGHPV